VFRSLLAVFSTEANPKLHAREISTSSSL